MLSLRWLLTLQILFLTGLSFSSPAVAEVERLELESRGTVAGGRAFGPVGPYEKLVGTAFFALDPKAPANRQIVDLDLAAKGKDGKVRFSADVYVLRPVEPERGNGALLLEVPNRGGKAAVRSFHRGAPRTFDPTAAEDFGDGFLMRRGFTLAWVGWQADLPYGDDLLRRSRVPAESPPAPTGWVRSDQVFAEPADTMPLGHRGHAAYPAVDLDDPAHVLTVREQRLGPRRTIPRDHWFFARRSRKGWIPDPRWVGLEGGFEPGKIYEVVYRGERAEVVGLGLAAVRDLASLARNGPPGPLKSRRVLGLGISQSGRFLRHLLYQGFHQDTEGRQVFDGLLVHTAGAGRGSFNHRFAQPSRDGHPFSSFVYPTDLFPFTERPQHDPVLDRTEGLLPSANAPRPKIFFTHTGYEYWGRAASLIHTSVDGARDVAPAPETRIYHFASTQHFVEPFPPTAAEARYPANPADFFFALRGLLVALDRWVAAGEDPPPSRFPRRVDKTLVSPEDLDFPMLPGVRIPRHPHLAYRLDFGPRFLTAGVIDHQPPKIGVPYPSLVPQVDADGNELGGLRLPEIEVPIATYTPWNWRREAAGAPGELADFRGSFLPFAYRPSPRGRTQDPRLSILERYQDFPTYRGRYEAYARTLVRDGYLLEEDLPELLEQTRRLWDGARTGTFR